MHTKLVVVTIFLIGICACHKDAENTSTADSLSQQVVLRDSSQGMTAHSGKMDHPATVGQMNSMNQMMVSDLSAADSEYDLRFIDLMIPHHEGAVMMAEDALGKAKHPELKKLCEDIIRSQNKEIDAMKQWRKSWYNR